MGIEDFVFSDEEDEVLCPECEEPSEHLRDNEYKCTEDSDVCSVVYFIKTDYELDYAEM